MRTNHNGGARMKRGVVLVSVMVMSLSAFAGKEEREMMKSEVMPAVKAAEASYKKSCGCALTVTVDEKTVKTTDDMIQVRHMADWVKDGAESYCTDDASKKAMCQLKSLSFA